MTLIVLSFKNEMMYFKEFETLEEAQGAAYCWRSKVDSQGMYMYKVYLADKVNT